MMINLYAETTKALKEHNLTWDDVLWIGMNEYFDEKLDRVEIPKADFIELAKNKNYNNGWGTAEINSSLVIVGDNWWLERGEYDGSEWWDYKKMPVKPTTQIKEINIDNWWIRKE